MVTQPMLLCVVSVIPALRFVEGADVRSSCVGSMFVREMCGRDVPGLYFFLRDLGLYF